MADAVDRPLLSNWLPNPLISAQRMETGAVLMDAATGDCFELNRIGAEVWEQIASGGDVAAMVAGLASRYGVAVDRVSEDVRKLIDQLLARGLVRLK
jgi:predicted Rdx family selenoprotein